MVIPLKVPIFYYDHETLTLLTYVELFGWDPSPSIISGPRVRIIEAATILRAATIESCTVPERTAMQQLEGTRKRQGGKHLRRKERETWRTGDWITQNKSVGLIKQLSYAWRSIALDSRGKNNNTDNNSSKLPSYKFAAVVVVVGVVRLFLLLALSHFVGL